MEITYPLTFIPSLKHKHLLLDTNVFRDVATKPIVFRNFFNELKKTDITLTTIDLIKYELLKGSADIAKYKAKETFINEIIDACIPLVPETLALVYDLIKMYGIDGTALSITDLLLGAILMQYKQNIYLMTRDTTDFMQKIFDLSSIVNIPHNKGIFTYGVYQYTK